jgi:DNA helicase-2/ATP-dependent DNA helicase PcrA
MLSYVADIQRRYSNGDKNNNKVKLMSLHRAKGLEFPIVFMSGMSDVLLPHSKSQYIEEERRLAYVGVTRAQQTLYVSYFETMRDRFVGASSFLTEMGVDIDG